jgi:putative heme-binding domain-containing protein
MTRSLSALLLAVAAGLTLTLVSPTPPVDAAPQKGKAKARGKAKGQPQPAVPARPQSATPANTLKVAKGFAVELLYSVPKDVEGSWVNLCTDPRGRLIVSDQYGGLFRVTPPPVGQTAGLKIEPIPVPLGEAQGLLWAFDSLYVVVNRGKRYESGLYRVTDTNGDDTLDKVELLRKINGGGEHGPHAVLPHPDGKRLTVVCGNQTKLTEISSSRSSRLWGEDHILPRVPDGNGFMKGVLAPGGYICNVTPDGKEWELVSSGFRNEFDAGYNRAGDLFTYDADMEWDFNTPWYRPTRVCHVTSGSEWGWRNGAGKYPPYYPDNLPSVVDVGPGSPCGVCFGYGAKFPQKYQDAFFICDWSYGKLYAVHLTPSGSTYKGEIEEFVTGTPLPLTDVVINPTDGAMYFTIGGRQTQSGLYRVTYAGTESPVNPETKPGAESITRQQLEAFHGKQDPGAVEAAWPHLGSKDRFIRYAARTALEHQPADQWTSRALEEKNPQAAITALLGLIRRTAKDPQHLNEQDRLLHPPDSKLGGAILKALNAISWDTLTPEQKLELARVYQVYFVRYGKPAESDAGRKAAQARFAGTYPTGNRYLDGEICQLLVFLDSPEVVSKTMKLLEEAPTQEEQLEYVRALRVARVGWTPELRKDYFTWFVKAGGYKGGNSFRGFLKLIKGDAVALLSPAELASLKPVFDAQPSTAAVPVAPPREFVKKWTIDELGPLVDRGLKAGGRDFDRGRKLFGAVNCFGCHRYDNEGGSAGPDLSGVAGRFNTRDLLESLLDPNKEVSDQYAAVEIDTLDGKKVVGRIVNLHGDTLHVMPNMLDPNGIVNVNRNVVDSIKPSKTSMMPTGLLDTLNESEVLDLMAYLLSRGDRSGPMFKK